MADCNRVGTYPDFFDQKADDFLPLGDIERFGARAELGSKISERFTQTQIASLIDRRRLDRLQLCGDGVLLRPERWHPAAQFLQSDQLLLVGRHQSIHGARHTNLLTRELVDALARRIGLSRRFAPAPEFRLHERGIFEEP